MLTEAAGPSIRRELIEFIKDLDVDEAAAVVALAWIGRDDFQPEEWKIAVAEAKERAEGPTWNTSSRWSLARLPGGCAVRLRPFLRGSRIGGRRVKHPRPRIDGAMSSQKGNPCYICSCSILSQN